MSEQDFSNRTDHWAVQCGMLHTFKQQPSAVAIIHVPCPLHTSSSSQQQKMVPVSVQLNPTDATSYRMIFRILYSNAEDIPFNKLPSSRDASVLGTATGVIAHLIQQSLGLYMQVFQLGNNSQSWDEENKCMKLGNDHEPYFLHFHGLFRGDPEREYLGPQCPALNGPVTGVPFEMIAAKKRIWLPDELGRAVKFFRHTLLTAVKKEEMGNSVELLLNCRVEFPLDVSAPRPSEGSSLFVYGTLCPGRSNHHELQHLDGQWREGTLRGRLVNEGWGAAMGCPGIVPVVEEEDQSGGDTSEIEDVRGWVLIDSTLLTEEEWGRLDAFEGPGYQRTLVDVKPLPDGRATTDEASMEGTGAIPAFVYALSS